MRPRGQPIVLYRDVLSLRGVRRRFRGYLRELLVRVLQELLRDVLRLSGEHRQVRDRLVLRFEAGGTKVRLSARTPTHGRTHAGADGQQEADRLAHGERNGVLSSIANQFLYLLGELDTPLTPPTFLPRSPPRIRTN